MDFTLSEEQALFRDSIDRFIAREYRFEQRRRHQAEPEGWSRRVWAQLAEQGFLALPFAEAHGGLGLGPVEMMLVCEALGRGLVVEPYLTTIVVSGSLLRSAASESQLRTLVPRIVAGELVVALASTEKQSRYNLADVATRAERVDGGYLLSGTKTVVTHGDSADQFIVSGRTSGARDDRDGISLFLLDASAVGLRRRCYRTQDGLRAADLVMEGVRLPADARLGPEGRGLAALERAREHAIAALAAETAGATRAVLDLTVDYLKQRCQFGGPIGRFQALQHRAAEMLIEVEQAQSAAIYAALMVDEPAVAMRSPALSGVKVQIGRSGRFVGQLAVQLHGGIGVSEEAAVGHYFRRLTMIESLFGDGDEHLDRVAFDRAAQPSAEGSEGS